MTLEDVREILDAEAIVGFNLSRINVDAGCGADLMSDVLAFVKPGALLLTGLTNAQVVRTSDMAGIVGICFVRGKTPIEDAKQLAASNNLPLLATRLPMFEACGRLYAKGLRGYVSLEDSLD